jgi:hypothetical protein
VQVSEGEPQGCGNLQEMISCGRVLCIWQVFNDQGDIPWQAVQLRQEDGIIQVAQAGPFFFRVDRQGVVQEYVLGVN